MKIDKQKKEMIFSFIIVFCVFGFVVYSIINKPIDNSNLSNSDSELIINNNNEDSIDSSSEEINYMDKENLIAKNGDTLIMNYTGRLEDGTIFDSNILPEFNHVEPFEFVLGEGMVIKGWDEGLVGMEIGEKKVLTISPDKGYGDRQVGPIPANSTLIFEVELLGIK